MSFPVFAFKVLTGPLDEMVLEHTLDNLVEDIRGDQLVDVCAREVICEWLAKQVKKLVCN